MFCHNILQILLMDYLFSGLTLLHQLLHPGRGARDHPLQGRVQRRQGGGQGQLPGREEIFIQWKPRVA